MLCNAAALALMRESVQVPPGGDPESVISEWVGQNQTLLAALARIAREAVEQFIDQMGYKKTRQHIQMLLDPKICKVEGLADLIKNTPPLGRLFLNETLPENDFREGVRLVIDAFRELTPPPMLTTLHRIVLSIRSFPMELDQATIDYFLTPIAKKWQLDNYRPLQEIGGMARNMRNIIDHTGTTTARQKLPKRIECLSHVARKLLQDIPALRDVFAQPPPDDDKFEASIRELAEAL